MEFYKNFFHLTLPFLSVSIPNGMEFYCALPQIDALLKLFQFPTGWNSTKTFKIFILSPCQFQFPTGMEFYKTSKKSNSQDFLFQFPTGWNSTFLKKRPTHTKNVSIPNGMEFYVFKKETYPHEKRFNSQRDGILLCFCCLYYSTSLLFQFPTGWNSTELCHLPNNKLCEFQFPTGWNSTHIRNSLDVMYHRFNSQRDGILLCGSPRRLKYSLWFQFPTGWNSTLKKTQLVYAVITRFNSQRDGILP